MCASTAHPGHRDLSDSQWTQWRAVTDFYRWCRGRGIYLNVPDWYFLAGSTKVAMGYREVNWSLPREQQCRVRRSTMSCFTHLSFSVDKPTSTSIMVIIQKRTTTWFSFQPLSS